MLRRFFPAPSLTRRRWAWRDADDRAGLAIAQALDLPEIVGRLLAARGLDARAAADYLAPTLRAAMPDPSVLIDMDVAAERLARAVLAGETVGVFGDYDVDGACAAALLATGLRALGCAVVTHIPDRVLEGYGPNRPALAGMVGQGATLLVCVDCGTAAGDVLAAVTGADIVVLDHHKSDVPPVGIVGTVNPNRLDDRSGLGLLCAAGIVFLALVATQRVLRRRGHFAAAPEPDLMGLLDIVALATVCDVVPLAGLNRALVAQGLRVLARRARPGLAALLDVAGVTQAPGAFTLGYALGPRMNAGGRIGDPGLGLRLLLTEDEAEAGRIAAALDAVNRDRRQVETAMFDRASDEAGEQLGRGHASVLIEHPDWHPGVVGDRGGAAGAKVQPAGLRRRARRRGDEGVGTVDRRARPGCGGDRGAVARDAADRRWPRDGGGLRPCARRARGAARVPRRAAGGGPRAAGAAGPCGRRDALGRGGDAGGGAAGRAAGAVRPGQPRAGLRAGGCPGWRGWTGSGRMSRCCGRCCGARAARAGSRRCCSGRGKVPLAPVLATQGPPLRLAGHLRVDRFRGEESVCFAIEDAAVMG